jgi:hypothetical protein
VIDEGHEVLYAVMLEDSKRVAMAH